MPEFKISLWKWALISWKVSAPEKVSAPSSQKRCLYNLLGTWDHLGREHSEKLKVTASEIVFYNSSWQIPAFKLAVELIASVTVWNGLASLFMAEQQWACCWPCLSTQALEPAFLGSHHFCYLLHGFPYAI